MKVFNLTERHIDYRGKTMGPYGSSDHPDLKHVPARDLAMAESGMLAFGSLPKGWKKPEPVVAPAPVVEKKVLEAKKPADVVKLEETTKVEVKIPPEAKPEAKEEHKKSKQKW